MNTGVIVLGHGSRAAVGEANDVVYAVSRQVQEKLGHDRVETAIMNRKSELPGIAEAVEKLVAAGAGRIVIVPMFFADGMHIRSDIPEEIVELKAAYAGLEIVLAAHIGADPRIADILVERIGEAG